MGKRFFIGFQRIWEVGDGYQKKLQVTNGFKVKVLEIKKDRVCLFWKLVYGQIKFRSNWGRYVGKYVFLISLFLFNCLFIYWVKKFGGDFKSYNDEDRDRLSFVESFQGRVFVVLSFCICWVRMSCIDRQDDFYTVQLFCSGVVCFCYFIFLVGS